MRALAIRHFPSVALLLLGASLLVLVPTEARAAVYTPTRFDDPPPNGCNPTDCSLREAIQDANASLGVADEIVLQAGTYQLSIPGTDEDGALDGDLDITNDPLTLNGKGPGSTIIDGGGGTTSERVVTVISSATIRGVTIRNSVDFNNAGIWGADGSVLTVDDVVVTGHTNDSGGYNSGIFSEGTLTVTNSSITGNRAGASCCAGVIQYVDGPGGPLGPLTIRNSTISGNSVDPTSGSCCAGVYTQTDQPILIDRSSVTNNVVGTDGLQAGIHVDGTGLLTITHSLVSGNSAEFGDAGIRAADSPLSGSSVSHTTVSGNTADDCCTGLFSDREMTVTNTTISGNVATSCCSGLWHEASGGTVMTVNNVTVTGNIANSDNTGMSDPGAGISNSGSGVVRVRNTISYGNTVGTGSEGPDCFGDITSQGHNIIGTLAGCNFTASTGDRIGVDPLLGPLADNGGPTPTHALLKGSPAIDAGDPAPPGSGGTACEGTDQRGVPRNCDIGAYERVLCGKVVVNVVGTDGKEKLRGTNAADGIYGLGGKDILSGAGGKDGLCGGKGKDTLKGGGGKDFLKGEQGKDTCIGGGGRDKAKCEKEKRI